VTVTLVAGVHPTIPRASGIRSYVLGLARALSKIGEDVVLVGVGPRANLDFATFCSINPRYPVSTYTFIGSLARWARHNRFDRGGIIHGQRPDDLFALSSLRRRIRLVCTLHGDPRRGVSERRVFGRLAYRFAERRSLAIVDRVISVSQSGLKVYQKRFPGLSEKMVFIPIGIDLGEFRPLDQKNARAALGLDDRLTILFAGRLESEKRIHSVANSLAAMPESPQLVVAGEGRLRRGLERSGDVNGIRFLGAIPHEKMPTVMSAADALVIPSAFEGFPTVALEALACGRPVIATRVGDLPLLLEEGRTGMFFDGTSGSLSKAVTQLSSLRDTERPCQQAALPFGWERVAPQVVEAYHADG